MTNWYAIFVGIGWGGVLLECVRPGWVVPGAAGAVLLVYGCSRLLPQHAMLAAAVSAPFIVLAAWMFSIGLKARRNKRTL
jgi:membrane-bound ClpP family serine protease